MSDENNQQDPGAANDRAEPERNAFPESHREKEATISDQNTEARNGGEPIPVLPRKGGGKEDERIDGVNKKSLIKQNIWWVAIVALITIAVLGLGWGYFTSSPSNGGQIPNQQKHIDGTAAASIPGQNALAETPSDTLLSTSRVAEGRLKAEQNANQALQDEIAQLKAAQAADRSDATKTIQALQSHIDTGQPVPNSIIPSGAGRGRRVASNAAPGSQKSDLPGANDPAPASSGQAAPAPTQEFHRTIVTVHAGDGPVPISMTSPGSQGAGPGRAGGAGPAAKPSPGSSAVRAGLEVYDDNKFVPPNAYAPAKVLVGVDGATGATFSADPKPVLLRILGPAVHVDANGVKQTTDLTGCLVNGAASAELPSEKVYIKLQRITCPAGRGKFSVASVEGYVSSRGKAGVRGQVISRDGALTRNALVAGTLSGLGNGLSKNVQSAQNGLTTVVGAGGALAARELSAGQIAEGALGSGVASASSMLADYYIKRAEQYQPVIEMPVGIQVEIVFLSGFQIK